MKSKDFGAKLTDANIKMNLTMALLLIVFLLLFIAYRLTVE